MVLGDLILGISVEPSSRWTEYSSTVRTLNLQVVGLPWDTGRNPCEIIALRGPRGDEFGFPGLGGFRV